jgi:hypothetical protein
MDLLEYPSGAQNPCLYSPAGLYSDSLTWLPYHIHPNNAGTEVHHIQNPQMLQGIICEPDTPAHNTRPAGLGIVIVNMQTQSESRICIKAILQATSSVIMAEAAAIALAAKNSKYNAGNRNTPPLSQ